MSGAASRIWTLVTSDGLAGLLVRAATGSFVIKIVGAAIALVTQIVLARLLGVSEYGKYVYALTWIGLIGLLAKHGMDTALTRFVPAYNANLEWRLLRGILRHSSRSVLLVSILCAVAGGIAVVLLRARMESGLADVLLLSFILLPIISLTALRQATMQALRHVVLAQLPDNVVRPVVLLAVAVVLAVAMAGPLNAMHVMSANIAAAAVAFVIGGRLLLNVLPKEIWSAETEARGSEWLRASMPMFFISGMNVVMSQTDIVMIGPMLGSDAAGMYAAVTRVTGLVGFGLVAVNSIVAPMISELYSVHRYAQLQKMITMSARGVFVFTIVVCLGLGLFGEFILGFFGAEFRAGYGPLLVLLVGQAVNALAGSVGFLMIMTGHQTQAAVIVFASAVANIALNAILIPRFGLMGAASATAATTALWNIAMLVFVHRKLGINSTVFSRGSYA